MRRNITKFPPYKRVKEKIIRTFQLVSVFNELRVIDNLILSIVRFEKEYKIGCVPATVGAMIHS